MRHSENAADQEERGDSSRFCFWSFINLQPKIRSLFCHEIYEPVFKTLDPEEKSTSGIEIPPLPLATTSRSFKFWKGFYDPFDPNGPLRNWHSLKWRCDFVGSISDEWAAEISNQDSVITVLSDYSRLAIPLKQELDKKTQEAARIEEKLNRLKLQEEKLNDLLKQQQQQEQQTKVNS